RIAAFHDQLSCALEPTMLQIATDADIKHSAKRSLQGSYRDTQAAGDITHRQSAWRWAFIKQCLDETNNARIVARCLKSNVLAHLTNRRKKRCQLANDLTISPGAIVACRCDHFTRPSNEVLQLSWFEF